MKIFLTGYKGFIGQNFVEQAKDKHELTLFEYGDDLPRSFKKFDCIVHLGAISSTTEENWTKLKKQNIDFSTNLFDKSRRDNVMFQFASSASVYGINGMKPFKEDDPKAPYNLYALSKSMVENYILEVQEYIERKGMKSSPVQIFRYFNVFGPHEEHKGDQASMVHKFTEQAKTDGVIKIFDGSECFARDFVHVNKIVNVHQRMMNIKRSGIWNIGSGDSYNILELAEQIALKYGATVEKIRIPQNLKNHYQTYTKADITKLKQYYLNIPTID